MMMAKAMWRTWTVAVCGWLLGAALAYGASENDLQGERVLIVLPPGDFRDEEYAKTREALQAHGAVITVASVNKEPLRGMLGTVVEPDCTLQEAEVDEFAAVVFVGGVGATRYFHDHAVHALAHQAVERGKVVGAICLAPVILANAGLLQGKASTVCPTKREDLRKRGAQVKTDDVVVEGKLVTASGPDASAAFGQALVKVIRETRKGPVEQLAE